MRVVSLSITKFKNATRKRIHKARRGRKGQGERERADAEHQRPGHTANGTAETAPRARATRQGQGRPAPGCMRATLGPRTTSDAAHTPQAIFL
eukprot:4764751-Prymnesium_polylepis.2